MASFWCLLFALEMFRTALCSFHFWLWECRHLWGIVVNTFLHFFQQLQFGLILSHRFISFMNKILQKEQCESSVDSFNAKISYVFYIYSSFDFEFIFKYYILSYKFYFSQNVETDTSGKFFFSAFVSLMPVNLNQYRGSVGVFNNCNIAICNYGTVNHFQTVILLSFLMEFSYVQLIYLLSKTVQSLHF